MSSDTPTQEFFIDGLPTTSVTIYPSRAHIVRDIADVRLRPGLNEVTIYGITPAADEHSVQVDGHGAATITDMSVELVPNRARFADQFSDDDSDAEDDPSDSEFERQDLRELSEELKELKEGAEADREGQRSANDQLRVLNTFMDSINAKHNEPEAISKAIASYDTDRQRLYGYWTYAKKRVEESEKQIRKTEAKLQKESKEERWIKKKEKEEREKERTQRQRERRREREEKAKFWPRMLYCVKLTLEVAADTPQSSRPGSSGSAASYSTADEQEGAESSAKPWRSLFAKGSLTLQQGEDEDEEAPTSTGEKAVLLSLSYVVREASWSPRYNVSISSLNKTATIAYSAEFSNKTSETWKDAKITLSTSQTSYSGLDEKVPELRPWPIFLRDKHAYDEDDHVWDTKFSPQENLEGRRPNSHWQGQDHFSRWAVFGPDHPPSAVDMFQSMRLSEPAQAQRIQGAHSQAPVFGKPGFVAQAQAAPSASGLFGNSLGKGFGSNNAGSASGLFGSAAPAASNNDTGPPPPPPATGGLFGGINNTAQPVQGGGLFGSSNNNTAQQPQTGSSLFGNATAAPAPPHQPSPFTLGSTAQQPQHHDSLHQEPTAWEDSGMTTAYELPGTRTLVPSSLARRHKLTTITVPDIALSYIAIPKLRKGAFLRAKFRNPSNNNSEKDDSTAGAGITLLAGATGLTLDSSFLGTASLPRTAPGESLSLDLGVDPAVHVAYAAPTLRRGATQTNSFLFGGGGSGARGEAVDAYARCITVTNARRAPVEISVRDQVPLSEQERLRVEVVTPRGLGRGAGRVVAGESAGDDGEEKGEEGAWGEASAEMGEGNVVEWRVVVEAGRSCRLPLEWEVRMPGDKRIAFA